MGTLAGRYEVLDVLGQGGMGTIYRTRDLLDEGREVALKTIRTSGPLTGELELRFKEEFRAMAMLSHPNTIDVYDYGQIDASTRYLTMELVPGQELAERIRGHQLPLDEVYELLIQLLQAMQFIHSRLYVHRDIKAENIRIRDDGKLKLMDFGLMERLGRPSTGKIVGTPGYLPPEVVRGGVIDATSDLYSIGCLAFEMITGRLPFGGANVVEVIRAHLHTPPPSLASLRPDVPVRLEQIVSRLLAKEPRGRYMQAVDVIEDLADLAGLTLMGETLEQRKSYLTSGPLVGREQELVVLREALGQAIAGHGRSVLVGAPAGVGKSRLVQELLLHAKLVDVVTLHCQCTETGLAPYEPLATALRPLLALSGPGEWSPFAAALGAILPEVRPPGAEPEPTKQEVYAAMVGWLTAVSRRLPLVLFFDDLHWSDAQSLGAFNACARGTAGAHVVCLATFRNDEAAPGSPLWYTIEDGTSAYLKLTPFTPAQVLMLVEAMLPDVRITEAFGQFLYDTTSGNAFFVTEVLRYLIEEGVLVSRDRAWHFPQDGSGLAVPGSVEATVVRRLSQLSDGARELARIAAVVGRYQDRDTLHALGARAEDALFAQLDELVERQFLSVDEHRYAFGHDRVREALYEEMPAGERRRIHEACARLIEARQVRAPDAVVNELAYHYARGEDRARAFRYLRRAGDLAQRAGISAVALEYWRQAAEILEAIDYPDKERQLVELWTDLGASSWETMPALCIEVLEKLIPLLEAQGDLDGTCAALARLSGWARVLPGPLQRRLLERFQAPRRYHHRPRGMTGLAPFQRLAWVQRVIESYGYLSAAYGYAGKPAHGLERAERALALLPFKRSPLAASIVVTKGCSSRASGRVDDLVAEMQWAGNILFSRDLKGNTAALTACLGASAYLNAPCYQGFKVNEAMEALSIECAERARTPFILSMLKHYRAVWSAWTGRFDDALAYVDFCTQHARKLGAPLQPWALYLQSWVHWQRGELEAARVQVMQALGYEHVQHNALVHHLIVALGGNVLVDLGELDEAERMLAGAEAAGRTGPLYLVWMHALLGLGRLALARGLLAEAHARAAAARACAASGPARNPLHQAYADRLEAIICLADGNPRSALVAAEAALSVVLLPEQDNLIEQGRLLALCGDAHAALGDPARARHDWHAAQDLFTRIQLRQALRTLGRKLDAGVTMEVPPSVGEGGQAQVVDRAVAVANAEQLVAAPSWEAFLEKLAAAVAMDFGSDRADVLVPAASGWQCPASIGTSGRQGEVSINEELLATVKQERRPLVAFQLPPGLALGPGSNVDVEVPSVLLVPLLDGRELLAVVYLVRADLARAFDETDLARAGEYAAALSQLWRRFDAAVRAAAARRAELAAALRERAVWLAAEAVATATLLRAFAGQLGLDGLVILTVQEQQLAVEAASSDDLPSVQNEELVLRVAALRRPLCFIDLPADLDGGSSEGAEMTSIAIVPLPGDGGRLLSGIRRSLEAPLDEADLSSLALCAELLAEHANART